MRTLVLMLLFLGFRKASAQPVTAPLEYTKNEKLSIDAHTVFRTNKFLDFKDQDTLLEIIDGAVYKATNLNRYFGATKDWKKILAEDTSSYRRPRERYPTTTYHYSYTDTSMTETYEEANMQYNMRKHYKTVYNLKGFTLYQEQVVHIGKELVETRTITNTFDAQNRVTLIAEKSVSTIKGIQREAVIQAVYAGNAVTVTSNNGTMICKIISTHK